LQVITNCFFFSNCQSQKKHQQDANGSKNNSVAAFKYATEAARQNSKTIGWRKEKHLQLRKSLRKPTKFADGLRNQMDLPGKWKNIFVAQSASNRETLMRVLLFTIEIKMKKPDIKQTFFSRF